MGLRSWPVNPPLPGSCMLLCSGKVKGETMMMSKLSKLTELWLEESRQCKQLRTTEKRNPPEGGETKKRAGMETEGGRMETDGRRKSSKVRGINENNCRVSSRREPGNPDMGSELTH